MPLIATRGAASAQGFGEFAQAAVSDGTKAIFALGLVNCVSWSTTRNKYTYATCASTACGVGTSVVGGGGCGRAAGNSTRGVFATGRGTAARCRHMYACCTTIATASSSVGVGGGTAAGNATRGIFSIGKSSCVLQTTRNTFTYATCTSASAAAASIASDYGSAVGNSTRGIFSLGRTFGCGYCSTSTRNKFTYACNSSTASGVASASFPSLFQSAAGNSTRGIIALGRKCSSFSACGNVRNKYTYACCTSTASGVATASVAIGYGGSAAGNSTRGIFALGSSGGSGSVRNKYTYACCTSTASGVGTSSSPGINGAAASWSLCVNA
jgi:hypothetical protein